MRSSLVQSDSTQSETLPGKLSGRKGKLALCPSLDEYLWGHCITFHMPQTLLKKTKLKYNKELKGSHISLHFALKQLIPVIYTSCFYSLLPFGCECDSQSYTLWKKTPVKILFIAYSWTSLIASTLKYTFMLSSMNHTGYLIAYQLSTIFLDWLLHESTYWIMHHQAASVCWQCGPWRS